MRPCQARHFLHLWPCRYQDAHTRFVLLRGGSRYQPRASSNFNNWYFGSGANKANHVASGGAVQFDRRARPGCSHVWQNPWPRAMQWRLGRLLLGR